MKLRRIGQVPCLRFPIISSVHETARGRASATCVEDILSDLQYRLTADALAGANSGTMPLGKSSEGDFRQSKKL